jgi:CubicO group peptidase (beta-lactamase class C family)
MTSQTTTDRSAAMDARQRDADARLERALARTARQRDIAGVVVRVERDDETASWTGTDGELDASSPFFIASVTKLYTAAIVLRYLEGGRLTLDDRLVDRVDHGRVDRLHIHRGVDRTDEIRIRHLLAQTSGLPDYFRGRRPDGTTLERTLREGVDVAWSLDDVLDATRRMGAVFPPGMRGKAHYSDTNHQLLGRVIELASGDSYEAALRREVIEPLRLERTWLYRDPADGRPVPLRDGDHQLSIPRAMASFGPDGGIVATVDDLMRFVRGFFGGALFDRGVLPGLRTYNRIFFPLQYGIGIARFAWPRILSPFAAQPELLGHSGLSGAFAFYAPARRTYLAGTVNNLARPDRSFRLMLGLLAALR